MYNIGFFNMNVLPPQNRIKGLYEEYYELLRGNNSVSLMPGYVKTTSKEDYLKQIQVAIEKYDVFFGYDRSFLQARQLTHKNVPVIFPLFADMTMGGMTLWINKNNFKTNDILLFSCKSDYDIYKKICVNSTLQTKVIPLPIGKIFEYYEAKKIQTYPNKKMNLLYVGRLTRSKNIHGLLELCKCLRERIDFCLVLVGSWDYYQDGREYKNFIERMIKQYDLLNFVIFKGYLKGSQLIKEYQKADVFINLTKNKDENFGLAQVEAMSQGLPVVCSEWGGLKDHVIQGWNGYKIKTQYTDNDVQMDLTEAAEYVCRLYDAHVRQNMSKNARQFYLKHYSRDVIINEIELLINNMINHNNEPAQIEFSDEAQNFCMQRIFEAVNHRENNAIFEYLNMYASNKYEDL